MMKTQYLKNDFATLLQKFFYQRLIEQRNSSKETVTAYRDSFRLFLLYLKEKQNVPLDSVSMENLNATTILAFLNYLEKDRHNSIRSRNARLAAIRSFLKYAALQVPTLLPMIQKVLAIPMKRFQRPLPQYLTQQEVQAILAAPDITTWSGKRDRVLLTTLYNTGARVSEIIALHLSDVDLGKAMTVQLFGKGRKHRVVPLWKSTAKQLHLWINNLSDDPDSPLFPNAHNKFMTRSGVESRLKKAVAIASENCSSLKKRRISPHVFRHTTAMHLLQSGADITVIALWLGHENPATTHAYVEADLKMKENALRKIQEPVQRQIRYKASEKVLQFLQGL